MDNKQILQVLLQRDSNGASPSDIAQEMEFIAAVRVGLDELDRREHVPIEEVERELPSWMFP
jgi:predicted transcriptional regulator